MYKVWDCSPLNRERELGLDRRETGQFYPTVWFLLWNTTLVREEHCVYKKLSEYERNLYMFKYNYTYLKLKASKLELNPN